MKINSRLCKLLLVVVLAANVSLVQAQIQSGRIVLQAPDTSRFPIISLTFEAYDSRGNALTDLGQAEVEVIENNHPLKVESLTRLQPGLHVIVAFNAGLALAATGGAGPSRFDQVRTAVLNWMQTQPANTPDVLSLVTNAGPQATRLSPPARWVEVLSAYTPELARAQPTLTSLTTALDLAGDAGWPNSKRLLLYITGPLPDANLAALPNLGDRAAQLGVRICIWLVQPAGTESTSKKPLSELAARTGGQLFTFTGVEPLPDPESYFRSLRYLYRVTYTSTIRQAGSQRVQLSIRRAEFTAPAEQVFNLNLEAPNPIFVAPPARVHRLWSQTAESQQPALAPDRLLLPVIVEFPDGLRRPLKALRLFVDGHLVSETTTDPINSLAWDLTGETANSQRLVRVEVEDSLGFIRSSIEIPVEVQVDPPPGANAQLWLAEVGRYLPNLAWLGGILLFLALGFLGMRVVDRWREDRQKRLAAAQPTLASPIPERLHLRPDSGAPAHLIFLDADGQPLLRDAIPLGEGEISLGSDPQLVDCVIESPSVCGLHARIMRISEGQYIINDAGTVAGTWVNDYLVPSGGMELHHGDRVHIGREAFRFELKIPPPPRQIRVETCDEVG